MPWNSDGPPGGPWGPSGGGGDRPGGNGSGDGQRPPPGGGGPWGSGGGPFGGRPGGGRPGGPGGQLPDFDELIKDLQTTVRRILGGGGGGFFGWRGIALFGIAVVAVWLASGFYRVQPDEQGVVLRFGAFDRTTLPGLNYHLPWPVEKVELPAVTRINRIEIGYRTGAANTRIEAGRLQGREIQEESLMLTGDENIIDIDCAVFWRISDAKAYLFNTRNPDIIARAVAESSMREVIGRTPIQPALTELRAQIEHDVLRQTQQILNNYGAGI